MSWPEIYFARHGETDWNRERRYQGTQDIPLNALGRKQADAIGPLMRELLDREQRDPSAFCWYASPLIRAVETMERMRAAFSAPLPDVVFDDRLREISFGALEGKLHDELPPHIAVAPGKREGDYWYYRPPQGESYEDLVGRMKDLLDELDGPAIIVAHGGILRVLRRIIEGLPLVEAVNWPPPQGTIAHFKDGQMTLHNSAESNVQQA